ncbi:probable cinnamyl alcohol dehydrogenase 3 [Setaria italica]|uniref:probable cinnamyl alcohol dehydrogenase 3 n=1 Tax=Setaria italica TaxID=4555 RepID=UPI000BE5F409|nr:probable cinnamyl alcohol dehydrogenase 3 [Setaria italica]
MGPVVTSRISQIRRISCVLTILRTGDDDVAIKVLYCGICHSDLHTIKNEWKDTIYPCVPGHEIAGAVTEVGASVTRFKAGDRVGVGCMVNSCQSCDRCAGGFENLCPGIVWTYNSVDLDGTVTYGGYSSNVVVHERFVVRFPDAMPLDQGAPLLCAGITVYSPMRRHGLDAPGKHVGVAGLGGLGHVAVKLARAFGARVTVVSSSPAKRREALDRLGADAFVLSSDAYEMKVIYSSIFSDQTQARGSFIGSYICDGVGVVHAGCGGHHGRHHQHGVREHSTDPAVGIAEAQRQDGAGRHAREAPLI